MHKNKPARTGLVPTSTDDDTRTWAMRDAKGCTSYSKSCSGSKDAPPVIRRIRVASKSASSEVVDTTSRETTAQHVIQHCGSNTDKRSIHTRVKCIDIVPILPLEKEHKHDRPPDLSETPVAHAQKQSGMAVEDFGDAEIANFKTSCRERETKYKKSAKKGRLDTEIPIRAATVAVPQPAVKMNTWIDLTDDSSTDSENGSEYIDDDSESTEPEPEDTPRKTNSNWMMAGMRKNTSIRKEPAAQQIAAAAAVAIKQTEQDTDESNSEDSNGASNAPSAIQQVTNAPSAIEQMTNAPSAIEQMTNAPTGGQQSANAPSTNQEVASASFAIGEGVYAPSPGQQLADETTHMHEAYLDIKQNILLHKKAQQILEHPFKKNGEAIQVYIPADLKTSTAKIKYIKYKIVCMKSEKKVLRFRKKALTHNTILDHKLKLSKLFLSFGINAECTVPAIANTNPTAGDKTSNLHDASDQLNNDLSSSSSQELDDFYDEQDKTIAVPPTKTQLPPRDTKNNMEMVIEELRRLKVGYAEKDLLGVHIPPEMETRKEKIGYLKFKTEQLVKDKKADNKKQRRRSLIMKGKPTSKMSFSIKRLLGMSHDKPKQLANEPLNSPHSDQDDVHQCNGTTQQRQPCVPRRRVHRRQHIGRRHIEALNM